MQTVLLHKIQCMYCDKYHTIEANIFVLSSLCPHCGMHNLRNELLKENKWEIIIPKDK